MVRTSNLINFDGKCKCRKSKNDREGRRDVSCFDQQICAMLKTGKVLKPVWAPFGGPYHSGRCVAEVGRILLSLENCVAQVTGTEETCR